MNIGKNPTMKTNLLDVARTTVHRWTNGYNGLVDISSYTVKQEEEPV